MKYVLHSSVEEDVKCMTVYAYTVHTVYILEILTCITIKLHKTLASTVDYKNRGHPDNENQSQGRTETTDSNIFKSSQ